MPLMQLRVLSSSSLSRRVAKARYLQLRGQLFSKPRHLGAVRRLSSKATFSNIQSFLTRRRLKLVENFAEVESLQPRLRVAVDVDEVLGQFLVALNSFCCDRYGMKHNVKDYHVYHFATVWGCSQEMSTQIVHEFFESTYFQQLPLVPGAFEALCELQEWCDLHVVTSRQHVIKDITIEWLSTHYPGIFTSVQFGNHFAREGNVKKKSELCQEINAHVLIDDNPSYALECAYSGIHVLLYNRQNGYPWSRLEEEKSHKRISEVTCWSDVPQTLRRLYFEQHLETGAMAQI